MKIARTRVPLDSSPVQALISVHGTNTRPEYPSRIEEVSRKGWGSTFWGRDATTNWFHIPFTVPNLVNGESPKLSRVFLFFHNTSRSPILSVHLYDGAKLLKAFDKLGVFGEHASKPDTANTFRLDKPVELKQGLGVSVNVAFPADATEKPPRWILFTSAMAEFRA
jgi:hypothetical protein